jgi:trigger factor
MQTVETLNEGLKRGYTITIPADDIAKRVEREIARVAPQVRMPGFRPGKVPANLIRKVHGPALEQDALNTAVQESVQTLIGEQQLRPAMQPSVELDEGYAPGKDVELKVALEVLPEIPEPKIDGLVLERLTVEATDSEVDAQVQRFAGQQKSFDTAPEGHAAENGDLVVMDYVGKVDGETFEGGSGEGMSIELGSGQLIPGFEDQLLGVKAGEDRALNLTFPEDYGAKYLAGRDATFDVTVEEIKVAKTAAADDEFAKSLGLEGIDQLRTLLRGQIEQELNGMTRTYMKRKLLDQLAEAHDFPVPPSMVEAEFDQIMRQLDHEASHEPDPAAARAELEAEREDYHRIAERRVRLGLLLSDIGQRSGVEVSQQEMNRLVAQAAQQYQPKDRERFYQYIQQDPVAAAQLRAPLYEDKVVDFLFSQAAITDRSVSRDELQAEIEGDEEGHVHGPGCGHDHHDHDHDRGHDHDHDHDEAPAKKPARKRAAAEAGAEVAEAPAPKAKRKPVADDAAKDAEPAAEGAKPARKAAAAKGEAADKPVAAEKPATAKKSAAKAAKAAGD